MSRSRSLQSRPSNFYKEGHVPPVEENEPLATVDAADVPADMHGRGGALPETEALRERVAMLEEQVRFLANPLAATPRRMVPLGSGWDAQGRPVMVPYYGGGSPPVVPEPITEPSEPADPNWVNPNPYKRPPTFVEAEIAWREKAGQMVDTRSGLASQGPQADLRTNAHIDRIAAGFDRRDRIDTVRRYGNPNPSPDANPTEPADEE
jgi:hypothetical protein